jgi:hypothetical protein
LLLLLLVFAQQVAVVHLSQHTAEHVRDHRTTTHTNDLSCPKCSLYASLGSSPPVSALILDLAPASGERHDEVAYPSWQRTVVAYQSRAPPTLL